MGQYAKNNSIKGLQNCSEWIPDLKCVLNLGNIEDMLDTDKKVTLLENAVQKWRIFIDVESLLSKYFDAFWINISTILQKKDQVIIPYCVYKEIEQYENGSSLSENKERTIRAKKALNIIHANRNRLIGIYGDDHDGALDVVLFDVFEKYSKKYSLMLITEDRKLAKKIIQIKSRTKNNTNNQILIRKINKSGYLSEYRFGRTPEKEPIKKNGDQRQQTMAIPPQECFAIATKVRTATGKLSITSIPGEGSKVYYTLNGRRQSVNLKSERASGGEGIIYATTTHGLVAKIYKPEKLNCAKYEKLKLMTSKDINCDGVCFPECLLYNEKKEFVGYLMQEAHGKELQKCVFIPQLLKANFPLWSKIDTVTLCVTILKKIKYLHDRNIILGDINPNNILVVSKTEVYFVDADSYQIEGYPCPVGTINYTAPEIQRKHFSKFLRTIGNERFAVATLLFMIMLPGKPPYALQGGENQIDNIINGDFAYPSGTCSSGRMPKGVWPYCWSHLPQYLKEDFYETFHKNGKHYTEKTRFNTDNWLKKFKDYLELLQSGKLEEQDPMSMKIFPERLRKIRKCGI